MSSTRSLLRLFAGIGVEMEYMIVDARTLSVRPISDELIRSVAREYVSDIDRGPISWSNELVLHVIELKTNGPADSLTGLSSLFQDNVSEINRILEPFSACLMPTAMHPWMDPHTETRLWPHEYSPVYEAYNKIFGCQGHCWANLQSTHLNLPFSSDEEFARLHAAIRLVLPILPALAASSPIMDGQQAPWLDQRLAVYRTNSAKIPSLTGRVIPEAVFSQAAYEAEIFEPMYRDIAPFDSDGVLQDEFLNSRGAIARFSRGSIEIRLIDIQECPMADIAIASAVVGTLQALVREHWSGFESHCRMETPALQDILFETGCHGEEAAISNPQYLRLFGMETTGPVRAGDLWKYIFEGGLGAQIPEPAVSQALAAILERGTLARRILRSVQQDFSREHLVRVYRDLCGCLADGRLFGK